MKPLEEIVKQEPIFLNDWSETKQEGLLQDFQIKSIEGKILFATYSYQDYSGDAFVLLENEGKLFEVNGGHCSCYGLEGQFDLSETTIEALQHRLVEGSMGHDSYCGNEYAIELKQFLGIE